MLRAYGVDMDPRPAPGGQGSSWIVADLVLKPGSGVAHQWLAEVLQDPVAEGGVRVVAPVATRDGAWEAEGWTATRFVEGSPPDYSDASTWVSLVQAARAFHRAVAHLPRPGFLDVRDDYWALADRAAWGERPIQFVPELADIATRLQTSPDPPGPPQVVHGDLTGNVLFASGLPPAVIDMSPYWRPPAYAEGVIVADALCWHGADESVLELVDVSVPAVARALLFRMATTNAFIGSGDATVDLADEAQRYRRAVAALGL